MGITFDEYLFFNSHYANIESRTLKRLNILKIFSHSSWHLSSQTLKYIYTALVGSIFNYSYFTVANVSSTNLNRLQSLQDRATRLIFKTEWNCPSIHLYKLSKITPIRARFIQLGCRSIAKSLKHNLNTNILIQEYLSSISSIKRSGKRATPLCIIFPYITLAFACKVFISILAIGLSAI